MHTIDSREHEIVVLPISLTLATRLMQDALLRTPQPTTWQALLALGCVRLGRGGGGAGHARRSLRPQRGGGMAAWARCHCSGPAP